MERPAISSAPTAKKLFIKPGYRIGAIGAPPDFKESLGALPDGATLTEKAATGLDVVIAFVRKSAEVEKVAAAATKSVKPDGVLWMCYPKGGAKAGTDINRDTLYPQMKALGFEGMGQASFSDAWSAMRFGPRK